MKGVYFKDDLIDADVPLNKIFIRIHSDAPMSCLRKLIINKLNSLGYLDNSLKVFIEFFSIFFQLFVCRFIWSGIRLYCQMILQFVISQQKMILTKLVKFYLCISINEIY